MRVSAQEYILKEYGSWSVLIIAFAAGIGVSRGFDWRALPLFIALGLLINSKQAFTKWSRKAGDGRPLVVFLSQLSVAALVLALVFGSDVPRLLPLLAFPAAYLLSNKMSGEHFILTELLGFILISLAAVLAKFLITGGLDVRLFTAVALYFTAGVFKVKAVLFRKTRDRVLTVLYAVFSVLVYHRFHVPVIILLPLVDNLIVAATLYRVKLRTTGWIEVGKGLLFLSLLVSYF